MSSFHNWLIRQRIWCDKCSDLTEAITVRNLNGKDLTLCSEHASRLDAVRKSERNQYIAFGPQQETTQRDTRS